jgi:serine/threonine-protein kinase
MLGKYERLDVLGHGASGIVYLAHDTLLHRQVAIKEITAGGEDRQRVLDEARLLDRLHHPNIVQLHSVDTISGKIVIDMEYVKGQTLQQIIGDAGGPLPIDRSLTIALQISAGLGYAHANNTVHRDIKPANVLVTETDQVKIVDFGLAQVLGTHSYAAGAGTYAYMAPEDFDEDARSDKQADVWALGVILYEMLTGTRPFHPERPRDPFSWRKAIEESPIDPPSRLNPRVPPLLDSTVLQALSRARRDRFSDAGEMEAELGRIDGIAFVSPSVQMPARSKVKPLLPGVGDIDSLVRRAPAEWAECAALLMNGHLEQWLGQIGESPLAEVARELSGRDTGPGSDPDSLLRAFLYRAGVDLKEAAREEARVGEALFRARAYDDAAVSFTQSARLDPSVAQTFRMLARAQMALGDRDAAREALEEGARQNKRAEKQLQREQTRLEGAVLGIADNGVVDFGEIRPGGVRRRSVTIMNRGDGVLHGRVAVVPAWMSVRPTTFSLTKSATLELSVRTALLTDQAGEYADEIRLETTGGAGQLHVRVCLLPAFKSFGEIALWYTALVVSSALPLLGGACAQLRELSSRAGHYPLFALGALTAGLLAASAAVIATAAGDVGPRERHALVTGSAFAATLGLVLVVESPDLQLIWMRLLCEVAPAAAALVALCAARAKAPKTPGNPMAWAWGIGFLGILLGVAAGLPFR